MNTDENGFFATYKTPIRTMINDLTTENTERHREMNKKKYRKFIKEQKEKRKRTMGRGPVFYTDYKDVILNNAMKIFGAK